MWIPQKSKIKQLKLKSRRRHYKFVVSKTGNVYVYKELRRGCGDKTCAWCRRNRTKEVKYKIIKDSLNAS